MEEFFAAKAATNDRMICIGALLRSEAQDAVEASLGDGMGLYLYLADASLGSGPIEVLAKVASEEAGRIISRLLGFNAAA